MASTKSSFLCCLFICLEWVNMSTSMHWHHPLFTLTILTKWFLMAFDVGRYLYEYLDSFFMCLNTYSVPMKKILFKCRKINHHMIFFSFMSWQISVFLFKKFRANHKLKQKTTACLLTIIAFLHFNYSV